jgi:O-antigen ligase
MRLEDRAPWPYVGLLAVVILSPLPLGSNRPLAWNILALVLSASVAGWGMSAPRAASSPVRVHASLALPAAIMAAIVGWMLAGLIPDVFWADPAWRQAEAVLGTQSYGSGSLDPDATVAALVRLASYLSVFWLALQYGWQRRRAIELVACLGLSGTIYALYGLVAHSEHFHLLPDLMKTPATAWLSGPFVNRNHFATYLALACLANVAVAIITFRERWRRIGYITVVPARAMSSLCTLSAAFWISAAVCAMALFATGSRMGMVALASGFIVCLLALAANGVLGPHRRMAVLLGALVLLAGLAVRLASIGNTVAATEFDRSRIFAMSLAAIGERPFVGHGYGTFASAVLRYRDGVFAPTYDVTAAHNVFLEMAVELGVPAAVAWVLAIGLLARCCLMAVLRCRRAQILPAAALASCATVAVHSLADFSVQIPAVAIAFSMLLAVGVAQSFSGRGHPASRIHGAVVPA